MNLEFRENDFADDSNLVTNTYLPLLPGTQLTYRGVADRGGGLGDHQVIFTVTDLVRTIDGVNSAVVWDRDINEEELQEAELSFFAQDKKGNVWNLGEYPEEYEDGVFEGAPSTWISGEEDARGGIHMPAAPLVGSPPYLQGLAPAVEFHDIARILDSGENISVNGTPYTDVLVVEEWDPQDLPAKQQKFHAPGIGIIKITPVNDPEGETLVLTDVRKLSAEDMAFVRKEAIKLEGRAYKISDAYREADPAGRFGIEHDIDGGDGDDDLDGGPGSDDIDGRGGDDRIDGGAGSDDIDGGRGDDRINGGSGRDDVDGGRGDDRMNGGAGKDLLHGGAGDDVVNGGWGDDRLWGDGGSDTFRFTNLRNGRAETDTIKDYDRAQGDRIDLPEGAGSVEAANLVDGVWQVTLAGDGDVIRLPGIRDVDGKGILNDLYWI